MCSTSNVNEALKGVGVGSNSSIIPSVSAHKVRQNRSNYFLVDVREESEMQEKPMAADAAVDAKMTTGALCRDASSILTQASAAGKKVVLICGTDSRAEIAARGIVAKNPSAQVSVVQRGMIGWDNIAATAPDFLVVLGLGDSTEKLSLSLAAAASAVDTHENVILVLMSDGVKWFLKPDSPKAEATETPNVATVSHGSPFKPCKAMLNKFLTNGGIILTCTTCVVSRGYSFETDMMECANPMQMPDLIRMMGEAKGGCLQFL